MVRPWNGCGLSTSPHFKPEQLLCCQPLLHLHRRRHLLHLHLETAEDEGELLQHLRRRQHLQHQEAEAEGHEEAGEPGEGHARRAWPRDPLVGVLALSAPRRRLLVSTSRPSGLFYLFGACEHLAILGTLRASRRNIGLPHHEKNNVVAYEHTTWIAT